MNNESDRIRQELLRASAYLVPPPKPSIRHIAKALGVTSQALYLFIGKGEVPAELAKRIELLTDGAVKREDLNPRIFS